MYNEKNKDKIIETRRVHRERNKEKFAAYDKERYNKVKNDPELLIEYKDRKSAYDIDYRVLNKDKISASSKVYRNKVKNDPELSAKYHATSKSYQNKVKANPELLERCRVSRRVQSKKRRNIPKYAISDRVGSGMNRSLKKGSKRGRHWEELVTFTSDELIVRLKSTLPEGYSWEDFLKVGIELAIVIQLQ